jgi:hypothetical protein
MMKDFIYNHVLTKFGIPSIADSYVAGLAHATKKHQANSLRMDIFASLVGLRSGGDGVHLSFTFGGFQ